MSNKMFNAVVADATNAGVVNNAPKVGNEKQIENSIKMESAKSEIKKYSYKDYAISVSSLLLSRTYKKNVSNYYLLDSSFGGWITEKTLDLTCKKRGVRSCDLSLTSVSVIAIEKEIRTIMSEYAVNEPNVKCRLANVHLYRAYKELLNMSGVLTDSEITAYFVASVSDLKKRMPKMTKKQAIKKAVDVAVEKAVDENKRSTVVAMLTDNMPHDLIVKYAGVTAEYVQSVVDSLK